MGVHLHVTQNNPTGGVVLNVSVAAPSGAEIRNLLKRDHGYTLVFG